MNKILITLCSILLLSGCASIDSIFGEPFKPEFVRENPKMVITKVKTEKELNAFCQNVLPEGKKRLGCARVPNTGFEDFPCYIYVYENGPEDVLEHEIKHCKYGNWHP